MSDLIDRRMAIGVLLGCTEHKGRIQFDKAVAGINKLPPAQPKSGRWIKISPANIYECSERGKNVMTNDICAYDFCHGCGAEMEVTT